MTSERAPLLGTDRYGRRVERTPQMDTTIEEAWQFLDPCGDDCHHPVHGFKAPRGIRHWTWHAPGNVTVEPE